MKNGANLLSSICTSIKIIFSAVDALFQIKLARAIVVNQIYILAQLQEERCSTVQMSLEKLNFSALEALFRNVCGQSSYN